MRTPHEEGGEADLEPAGEDGGNRVVRALRSWKAWVGGGALVILTGIVAFTANATVILSYFNIEPSDGPPSPTSTRLEEAVSEASSSPAESEKTSTTVQSEESGSCVTLGGQVAGCTAVGSGITANVDECSPAAVLATWGYGGRLQADIETGEVNGSCVIVPGPTATSAGATAQDIEALSGGEPSGVLLICARSSGSGGGQLVDVSCTQDHEYEYVSGWESIPADTTDDVCDASAREYTRTRLSADSGIRAERAERGDEYRCLVYVEATTLDGTLYQVGDRELPVAGD